MWPFDQVGYQASRAGNAFANTFGGGVKTDPNQYDFWGTQKQQALPAGAPVQPIQPQQPASPTYAALTQKPQTAPTPAPFSHADATHNADGVATGPATNAMNLAGTPAVLNSYGNALQENRQRFNQVFDKISSQPNPYDPNSEAFKQALAGEINRTNQQFSGADQAAQAQLAGRGMLGSGYEAATLAALTGQREASLSNARTGMYADAIKNSNAFTQNQNSALAGLVNGDYSGTLSALDNLAKLPGQVTSQDLANQGSATQNEIAKTQLRIYANQANMDEQTFNQALQAKKAELDAARAQGREAEWMSNNSWWLGPLKAAVNVGTQLGVAVLGGKTDVNPTASDRGTQYSGTNSGMA